MGRREGETHREGEREREREIIRTHCVREDLFHLGVLGWMVRDGHV